MPDSGRHGEDQLTSEHPVSRRAPVRLTFTVSRRQKWLSARVGDMPGCAPIVMDASTVLIGG